MENTQQLVLNSLNQLLNQDLIQFYNTKFDDELIATDIPTEIITNLILAINRFIDLTEKDHLSQEYLLAQLDNCLDLFDRPQIEDSIAYFVSSMLYEICYATKLNDTEYKILRWQSGESTEYWYRLRDAVYNQNYIEAERLLAVKPDLTASKNRTGETVLHFLAVENDLTGVTWLYQHGFSLDNKTEILQKPIIFEIATLGYKDLLQWFYEHGANFSATNHNDHNIYQILEHYQSAGIDDYSEMIKFIDNLFSTPQLKS